MSVEAENWSHRVAHLRHPEKNILNSLAWCLNDKTSQCNPGLDWLARDIGVTAKETVKKGIRNLASLGFIRVRRERGDFGLMKSNSYTLQIGKTITEEQARDFYGERPKRKTGITERNEKLRAERAAIEAGLAAHSERMKGIEASLRQVRQDPIDEHSQGYAIATESRHSEGIHQGYAVAEPGLCRDATRAMACAEPELCHSLEREVEREREREEEREEGQGANAGPDAARLSADLGRASLSQQGEKGATPCAGEVDPALAVAALDSARQCSSTPPDRDDVCWLVDETWPLNEREQPHLPPGASGYDVLDRYRRVMKRLSRPVGTGGFRVLTADTLASWSNGNRDRLGQCHGPPAQSLDEHGR